MTTTQSVTAPILAAGRERYAASRAKAEEITRILREAYNALSSDRFDEAAHSVGNDCRRLYLELVAALDTISPRPSVRVYDDALADAEAATGFGPMISAIFELREMELLRDAGYVTADDPELDAIAAELYAAHKGAS